MAMSLEKIRLEILNNPGLENEARALAEKILQENKQELIQEFNNHPVTREIEAGAGASNSSGTLNGKGNLFSFIGFDSGDNPIQPVRDLLNNIQLSSSKARIGAKALQFKVNIPDQAQIESISKMPWESGRSWVTDMERTISGIGQYLYGLFNNSRSGTGVQATNTTNSQSFRPVKYLNTMLQNFSKKLKGS
jgi:hypothetical protein